MRLTLRTMLAYMDDVLDPEDHAEMGKKIEDSKFATDLVHRTHDVLRRMRLGAPQLMGRGMGLDPNTVAEYLDSTLPPEKVADFEKVCLESDVHLAEAAACHQVLTLVLGEPAEVTPDCRERMYQIPEQLEAKRQSSAVPESPAESPVVAVSPRKTGRKKPEVPDYLRKSRRGGWKTIAAVLLVAAGIGAVVYTYTAENPPPFLAELLGIEHDGTGLAEAPAYEPPAIDLGSPIDPNAATSTEGSLPEALPASLPESTPEATEPPLPEAKPPVAVKPQEDPEPPAVPDKEPGKEPAVELAPDEPAPKDPAPAKPTEEPVVKNQVGIYVSDNQVLLRWNQADGIWQRLPSRTALTNGDKLMALPTFRPTLTLRSGVAIQMAGGTSLVLGIMGPEQVSSVEVLYGRVVLMGIGQEESPLHLVWGQQHNTVVFGDADSTLAVQVHRQHVAGADPEAGSAPATIDLYAASGNLRWEVEGKLVQVAAPSHWQLPGGVPQAEAKVGALPAWINEEELSNIDHRASVALEESLPLDRPIGLSLLEHMDMRRSEVRSLAARCAVYTGQFVPFVAALNDPDQRAAWFLHIEALRDALALDPSVAKNVREAFVTRRGNDGEALYRMLWGYSEKDLSTGVAKELVGHLDHDRLDFRVLSFWNLRMITGLGLNYRPEYNVVRRKQSVQRWQQRLESGEIRPRSGEPAQPIDTPKPTAEEAALVP